MGVGRHSKRADDGPEQRFRAPGLLAAVVVFVLLVAVGSVVVLERSNQAKAGGSPPPASGGHLSTTTTNPSGPLTVTSISPAPGATGIVYRAPVTVSFSEPLAAHSALPAISPAPPGTWHRVSPTTLRFVPDGNYVPYSSVSVTIPSGSTGVKSRYGQVLAKPTASHFTVAGGSELRLQQLLAELDYLPVTFVPSTKVTAPATEAHARTDAFVRKLSPRSSGAATTTTTTTAAPTTTTTAAPTTTTTVAPTTVPPTTVPPATAPASTTTTAPPTTTTTMPTVGSAPVTEPTVASSVSLNPVAGSFAWRFPNIPASLSALWTPGEANVITTGAIMAFENAEGMTTDGEAGPAVWAALVKAVAARKVSTQPYDYVYVQTTLPETAYIWRNGSVIYSSLANTGIPAAPTAVGTWPVYARYTVTTMSGTNPDGSHYSDPGIPWVSYFNGGDALHGYIRASYGFPQSLGCVELPYSSAAAIWPLTPLGTLVTIL